MNKYHQILNKILTKGNEQKNKKGNITYLTNQALHLKPVDLLEIFEGHGVARKKLKDELNLFMAQFRRFIRFAIGYIPFVPYSEAD